MQDDFHEDQTRQSSLDPHEITHLLASSGATVSPSPIFQVPGPAREVEGTLVSVIASELIFLLVSNLLDFIPRPHSV